MPDISFRIAQKVFDHAPEYGKQYGNAVLTAAFFAVAASKYGKQYGNAVLTAAFFAVAASKIWQTIRL